MSRHVPEAMKFGPWVTMILFIIILSIIATCVTTRYLADNFHSIVNCDGVDSENYVVSGFNSDRQSTTNACFQVVL